MKQVVFAILVAVPSVLLGWVVGRGQTSGPSDAVAIQCNSNDDDASGFESPTTAKPKEDEKDSVLRAVFGKPVAGATVKGELQLYDAKGLFDYVDGAAPMYIDRGFRKLAAAELISDKGGELTGDVYDMGAPKNAESIFEAERSDGTKEVASWPEAISGPRSFVFHFDRYYVKLTAFDANSEAALLDVAREVKARLK